MLGLPLGVALYNADDVLDLRLGEPAVALLDDRVQVHHVPGQLVHDLQLLQLEQLVLVQALVELDELLVVHPRDGRAHPRVLRRLVLVLLRHVVLVHLQVRDRVAHSTLQWWVEVRPRSTHPLPAVLLLLREVLVVPLVLPLQLRQKLQHLVVAEKRIALLQYLHSVCVSVFGYVPMG